MKKEYQNPEFELEEIPSDIVTMSGEGDGNLDDMPTGCLDF